MTDIEFKKDYGYPDASPGWFVEHGGVYIVPCLNREDAEKNAAVMAAKNPGEVYRVLAVMATITTSVSVVGQRFDPTRVSSASDALPEPPPAPEANNVESPL